jgi:hypothetical protein
MQIKFKLSPLFLFKKYSAAKISCLFFRFSVLRSVQKHHIKIALALASEKRKKNEKKGA